MEKESILSIEKAVQLRNLGVNMDDAALVSYLNKSETDQTGIVVTTLSSDFKDSDCCTLKHVYRYTLAELLNKLPINIEKWFLYIDQEEKAVYYSLDYYDEPEDALIYKKGDTLLDAVYVMYCWYLENEASIRRRKKEFDSELMSKLNL